jgi:hypothetical protein
MECHAEHGGDVRRWCCGVFGSISRYRLDSKVTFSTTFSLICGMLPRASTSLVSSRRKRTLYGNAESVLRKQSFRLLGKGYGTIQLEKEKSVPGISGGCRNDSGRICATSRKRSGKSTAPNILSVGPNPHTTAGAWMSSSTAASYVFRRNPGDVAANIKNEPATAITSLTTACLLTYDFCAIVGHSCGCIF